MHPDLIHAASASSTIDYIGAGAVKVITRLMGLILAVVGSQMLMDGIHSAWLQWH